MKWLVCSSYLAGLTTMLTIVNAMDGRALAGAFSAFATCMNIAAALGRFYILKESKS